MAVFTHLETDTGTNVDISAATAVGAYTANADKLVMCDVSIDAVAGNGDYVMYVTRQIGGAGSAYRILPQTTMAAASGLTAISGQSGWITVRNGDVLTVYIDGLAGDTTTPDWTTRWFEDSGTAGVAVASIATDAITAAALKADAVTEIQNGLALEATLTAIKGGAWTTGDTIANINFAISLLDTALGTIDNFLDTEIAAILADTNELQTYLVDGGRLDLLIDSIKAKTDQFVFTTPNKVDATATVDPTGIATSAALAVVDANVDAIKVKTDALDNSAVTFVTAVNGTTITVLRGDTLSGALTDVGALTDYVSIDFTVKERYADTDDDAIIRIRKNATGTSDGLLRLNKAAASSGLLGSITIDDLASGDITIALAASCTDDLETGTYVYDIQMISAAGVKTLTYGKLIVSADVTRLVV